MWFRGTVNSSNDGWSGPGQLADSGFKQAGDGHRDRRDSPPLAVNYRETPSSTRATGLTDVNKPPRSGFDQLGIVIRLFPSLRQTKKVNLTVGDEVLEKMSLACQ